MNFFPGMDIVDAVILLQMYNNEIEKVMNGMLIYMLNQNKVGIPFYISPIGDPPQYRTYPGALPKR